MAPASSKRSIAVAEYGGIKFSKIFEPQVVRIPLVQILSFTAIGTPNKGFNVLVLVNSRSKAFARSSACSRVRVRKEFNLESTLSILSKVAWQISVIVAS